MRLIALLDPCSLKAGGCAVFGDAGVSAFAARVGCVNHGLN